MLDLFSAPPPGRAFGKGDIEPLFEPLAPIVGVRGLFKYMSYHYVLMKKHPEFGCFIVLVPPRGLEPLFEP